MNTVKKNKGALIVAAAVNLLLVALVVFAAAFYIEHRDIPADNRPSETDISVHDEPTEPPVSDSSIGVAEEPVFDLVGTAEEAEAAGDEFSSGATAAIAEPITTISTTYRPTSARQAAQTTARIVTAPTATTTRVTAPTTTTTAATTTTTTAATTTTTTTVTTTTTAATTTTTTTATAPTSEPAEAGNGETPTANDPTEPSAAPSEIDPVTTTTTAEASGGDEAATDAQELTTSAAATTATTEETTTTTQAATTTETTTTTTQPTAPPAQSPIDRLQSFVDSTGVRFNAAAIQVAAIRGSDWKIFTWNYGYANKYDKPMTSDYKIRSASIAKVLVAIDAVMLQEDNVIGLEKRANTYWSSAGSATIRQLLTHTGGGSWAYSNDGYNKCGRTLEYALGRTLDSYSRDYLFGPLGMDASFFAGDIRATNMLATHYYKNGTVARSVSSLQSVHAQSYGRNTSCFAGGLTASATDICKLFSMLANDGSYGGAQVLTPSSVAALEKVYLNAKEYGSTFGQCLALRKVSGYCGCGTLYYHTAHAYGVLGMASYDPETGNAVVVLATGVTSTDCVPYAPSGTNGGRDSRGVYAVGSEITAEVYKSLGSL